MKILMIDIGGTNVKLMASGTEGRRKVPSGPKFKPSQLVREVLKATEDWEYEVISLGYPGLVVDGRPANDAFNLGGGWLKFDYEKAFKCPVRFINDASMQALASYREGRMLFLGFGTGIGSTIIVDDVIVPLEIGNLRLGRSSWFKDRLGNAARQSHGKRRWRKAALDAIAILQDVFRPDDVVIGGGNGKDLEPLPAHCRVRDNQAAFLGATRLWPGADMIAEPYGSSWRIRKHPTSEHPPARPVQVSPPKRKTKRR
jgi:polyphosphate glucokinase